LATAETWPNPWPMYRALRDHDPVHHVVPEARPDHDYYVLSRHADIWAAARDHETFSSAQGLTVNYGELELIGLQDNPPFVMQDPPVHTEFRKLVSRGFTPRQVEAVEPKVREFVVERIERLRANGGGDIVAELFKPLPSMVVAH
jgi:cytochrome P450 family 130